MRYLVMECHPGYAVVLDGEGRFLKVANLHYTVGQTVTEVVMLAAAEPAARRRALTRAMVAAASISACFCLLALGSWRYLLSTYGLVRLQINPDVRLAVNRLNYVIDIDGLNGDGETLIQGYQCRMKTVDQVSDELADRAVAMGYLKEGGRICVTVQSEHDAWKTATEERLLIELEVHVGSAITVTPVRPDEIVIPIDPQADDDERDDDDKDDRNDDDDRDEEADDADEEDTEAHDSDGDDDDDPDDDQDIDHDE